MEVGEIKQRGCMVDRRITAKPGETIQVWGFYDCHIDSTLCHTKRLKEDIQRVAADKHSRVVLGGDVFDAMWAFGDPRGRSSLQFPALANSDKKIDVTLAYACEMFAPIADKIDAVLSGNHEEKFAHRHGGYNLAEHLAIELGLNFIGYMGFLTYFVDDGNKHVYPSIGYLHHGAGGNAPMTKGMLDLTRSKTKMQYDWHMRGHIHEKTLSESPKLTRDGGFGNGRLLSMPVVAAIAGTYQRAYSDDATAYYSEEREHAPSPIGAARIYLTPRHENDTFIVYPSIQD
jgi:hypothetical protein